MVGYYSIGACDIDHPLASSTRSIAQVIQFVVDSTSHSLSISLSPTLSLSYRTHSLDETIYAAIEPNLSVPINSVIMSSRECSQTDQESGKH